MRIRVVSLLFFIAFAALAEAGAVAPPVVSVSILTNAHWQLFWDADSYVNYQLQYASDLAENSWTDLGNVRTTDKYYSTQQPFFGEDGSPATNAIGFYRVTATAQTPAEITGIPDGISIRMLTLDNPKDLNAATWDFTNGTTAQDVLAIIEDLKPNVLDRFITGKQDPDALVPVDPGEPPMTVLEFLDAAQAAGAPDCIITPKINLKLWSWEKIFMAATNLYSLPLQKPIRVVNLDNYPHFYDNNPPEYVEARIQELKDVGFILGGNFAGGATRDTFGLQTFGIFNVDKYNGFVPKIDRLNVLKEKPEMAKFYLYIDYPGAMDEFTALPVDQQADIYIKDIHPAQEQHGFTYSYTILQDGWDARDSYTTTNGSYAGKSMYDITKELINLTRGTE